MSKQRNLDHTSRAKQDRSKALHAEKDRILAWYLQNNGDRPPAHQCVDANPIRHTTKWWLEPPIPGIVNPRIVEETLGDSWTLRVEPLL